MVASQREARLRPEYANLYPNVPAGIWMPAADMGVALLRAQLAATTPARLGSRLMDEAQFEFRGGRPRAPDTSVRSRLGEPGAPCS